MRLFRISLAVVAAMVLAACGKETGDKQPEDQTPDTPETPAPQEHQKWTMKVMSYNIRVPSNETDPNNNWQVRKVGTPAMLLAQRPAIFGLQEAVTDQIVYIASNIEGYTYYGLGRDNGKAVPGASGEIMAIFWKKSELENLSRGTFWLSETPDQVSLGWDAACRRTATWGIFLHKASGRQFLFVNTHLDHKGATARKEGLKLIVKKIQELNPDKLPVVLTGDFNVQPDDECIAELRSTMKDARVEAPVTDQFNTYNAWTENGKKIIDFIWFSGFDGILYYHTLRDPYGGVKLISDHYPITAGLVLKD
ncbi:MAG: endonuclease/exonuclease/phosphatase family protein [Bacteroidales bacterium]|nr:endonuclease/exonuclease/phosphatase family protein [Bacteroidales bacterium]